MKNRAVVDVECYKNYLLISFLSVKKGTYREFEMYDGKKLDRASVKKMMDDFTTISFNGEGYDNIIIMAALKGYSCSKLKELTDKIITRSKVPWMIAKEHKIFVPRTWDYIDLMSVAPGMASLKIYGGRMRSKRLQDLPIEPDATITPEQRDELRLYCRNDLITTKDLLDDLTFDISLREKMSDEYGVDLRSKGGAQIAAAVLKSKLESTGVRCNKNNVPVGSVFKYDTPDWVEFDSDVLNDMLSKVRGADFVINDKGSVVLPKELSKAIAFDGDKYKFGIGGLHSQEKARAIIPSDDELLFEADVGGYYPSIIIERGLYPDHLSPKFLEIYSAVVKERMIAKRSGDKDKANSLKLVVNSTFGLLGNKYSYLYSPKFLIQTTITGQLGLLMLIEKLYKIGIKVVSANTDGVVIHCKKNRMLDIHSTLYDWELSTGYDLEETFYNALYMANVNNYIAIKTNGGVKGKGTFADLGLMKNPAAFICVKAVKSFLGEGVPIEQTILNGDVTDYLTVRTVNGGAVWRGEVLGKAVRFYHSTDGDMLSYKKNGNKVPTSDGCRPMMDLVDNIPGDLDFNWYINNSKKLLATLGVH